MALEQEYDYVFLVDADLILHPKTLVHLISLQKDIVAEVFWTRWQPNLPLQPQVWLGDAYRLYQKNRQELLDETEVNRRQMQFFQMLAAPGTYKVGGVGACTLISRHAIAKGVSFSEIYNVGFWGEDRHFSIRAAALGFELFADTHYEPYHIYRESDLAGVAKYKEKILASEAQLITHQHAVNKQKKAGITLAMLVRNEADRYLKEVLEHAAQYIDQAVILDDASEDNTVEVCQKALANIPCTIVSNEQPSFNNEIVLRQQLWNMAVKAGAEWILILDADEKFEDKAVKEIPLLTLDPDIDVYYFRLYDMWDEQHYREDTYWQAHLTYRPFMLRYKPGFPYKWLTTPQHCGRFPVNIKIFKGCANPLRIKHLGWMKPADRLLKYRRYMQLDPEGKYGVMEQYKSILDTEPRLLRWEE
ncbi:glycosyltransferase [Desulforamulus hydrothermalis]|uniref:Glycosyl transferase family 2 n=1 Tax=Desulforamulus hydrothermalis Lam5 = DSM 18033 TaxID=1121428 RepID=K8EKH3_9FIRM|nr:glycosyltransferase [Desulforamulus hydrothermalis]CCO09051.1 Glycosyl transferase family 2 [Desulforamulus hydrothermalis Lam5 = DSM 18033]SHG77914.1 Glycosyl transferase family 2 [Desulforamulus hydrothermalis Lam5 = DSM 18033]